MDLIVFVTAKPLTSTPDFSNPPLPVSLCLKRAEKNLTPKPMPNVQWEKAKPVTLEWPIFGFDFATDTGYN